MDSTALSIIAHALLTAYPDNYCLEDRKELLGYKIASDANWLLNHLQKEWEVSNERNRAKRRKESREL